MLPTPCSLNALDPIPKLGAKVVKLAPPAPPAPEPGDDWRYATDRDICGTAAFELVHESPRTPLEKAVDDFLVHQAAQMRKKFGLELAKGNVGKVTVLEPPKAKQGIYDNPITYTREIWEGGRLVLTRNARVCDGGFYAPFGSYPAP